MIEENTWEKEKNLKNAKELIEKYEDIYKKSVRRVKEDQRGELPGRYTAKLLYRWDNGKFEEEYLKKLERNWRHWKEPKFFQRKNLKRGGNVMTWLEEEDISDIVDLYYNWTD